MSIKIEDLVRQRDFDYSESAPEVSADAFEAVVRSRRSARVYTDAPVPEDVMRRCLELALLAPNSSNLQPWEFYWVRDADAKQELVRLCLGQPAAATAQELVACVARLDTWKRNCQQILSKLEAAGETVPENALDYYRHVVPIAYEHGPCYLWGPIKRLLMFFLAWNKPMPRQPASKADMRVWAHKSTALACENFMLAVRAYGFDSCPMEGMDGTRVRKLLKLPRGAEVCMVISVGKRARNGIYGPQMRLESKQFLFEV